MRRLPPLVFLSSLLVFSLPPAAPSAVPPAAGNPALVSYLDGLDGLMQGRWTEAVAAFSRTLEAAGDAPSFVLARGVAETMAEQFPQAIKDFQRAKSLQAAGKWT